jgi:hypothetical protein
MQPITVQGRRLDAGALAEIQATVDANPSWSRRRIADELVQRWDWRNGAGRLKDMSCRQMLARLESKALVRLTGHRLALVETFVDENRFRGICYTAANWLDLGRTVGWTRDDRTRTITTPVKQVRVLPLMPVERLRQELAG